MKVCIDCKKELPLTEFRKSYKWFNPRCCDCYRERKKQEWARWKSKRDNSYFKEYRKNNKEKLRAKAQARYAVEQGKLTPLPCAVCGEEKSEKHHPDYKYPLEVIWLCHKHHMRIHKQIPILPERERVK